MMIWSRLDAKGVPVSVNVPHQAALLDDLLPRLQDCTGFAVATLNLDHVVKLSRDPTFLAAYTRHTYVTADGNPIVWLSRLAGQHDVSLTPGSDLVEPLIALAAENDVSIGVFGSSAESLDAATSVLSARHPSLQVVFARSPSQGFDPDGAEADAAIDALRTSGARLVFLALGAPKQERFAARALAAIPEAGFVSVGAGLDFVSGVQTRAPAWARAVAAEWLWRLLGNPRRMLLRYGACLLILPGLVWRALSIRWAPSRDGS
ncbi:MAG: WecB/TagA/CpsF family glycosyltransferase [Pseudomonadota bacterium]